MEVQKKRKKEQLSGSDSDASLKTPPVKHGSSHHPPLPQQPPTANTSTAKPNTTMTTKELLFQEKIDASSRAMRKGDYPLAIRMYTEALDINPSNYMLYSNRSSAFLKMRQFEHALKDARKAKELKPKWPKAYIREAAALRQLGREADALASLASGLVQDAKNTQLLETLVNAAAQSQIKEKFVSIYSQLQTMHLEVSPFVIISVIGQELQSVGCYSASLTLLESALRIGTCSLKLRGSVFSALSTAHWSLGNIDKAIACMQQDLAVAKSLGDQEGECRAHGNLGAAYFSKGSHGEAVQHRRAQLILATRFKEVRLAAEVLSHLGHVYMSMGDYAQALASHQHSVKLIKQGHKDKTQEAREIGNVGAVLLAMGESAKAIECHNEHLKLAKQLSNKTEEARAYSDLGSAHHYKRDFDKAVQYHNQVLHIAAEVSDRTLEARAYAGLGHAARCLQNWALAKQYHEKQLDNALQTKDKVAEGRSCSNLGIVYQQMGEYDVALKLHKQHLQIAKDLGDRASQGRAYGNIGNAYSALGQYDVAIRFHKQELAISKEVCDKNSESSTQGNLAVAYQSLKINDKALYHYTMHLQMSRELKDSQSEARSLSNMGNFHSSLKQYADAIPCYEQYLSVSQELLDTEGEGKACHKLGYVHYCIGNYREAIRYYEQDLALAKDLQDKSSMCRAYCNLGLAHKALGDYPQSLECQRYFLATAHMTKSHGARFSALGHIGDVLLKLDDVEQAVQMFNQQLQIAKQCKERRLEAMAYGHLGAAHRTLKQLDKALAYHNQELTIYQELNDVKGECKAHGHLGNVHMSLGNYTNATRCYEEMLDHGRELKDSSVEALAYGNLGIAHLNLGHYDDAIGLFEQQLGMLEQFNHHQIKLDKARAFGSLGDCYEALGDYEEAVKCYEQYLAIAQNTNSAGDQDKAYRGLGNAHKALGNLQQSLVCFEKRLVVTHEMDKPEAKSSAYGELGCLHSLLGNFEQAISCLESQLRIAREQGDVACEGEAVCGLGGVYQQMGEYDRALEYHQMDLDLATRAANISSQCRAFGNLGLSHESLGNYEDAIHFQEQHLSVAVQMADNIAKTLAYSSLGRVHHAMGNYPEAIRYLKEGLSLAEQFNRREDEAKIRHRLGLALWGHGDLEDAQRQLYKATDLFESIRREAQYNNEYKLSMFDLQTASYQVLQRVLVSLGRHEEALVVAERGRTRAFVDFLLERQKIDTDGWYRSLDSAPVTMETILETVAKQKAAVMYYSLAAGYLYCWLITPEQGIVKFHESSISDLDCVGSDPEDTQSLRSFRSLNMSIGGSVLDGVIGHVRESLGVEAHLSSSRPSLNRWSLVMSETESEADDIWQQHLEELGERLNAENDRTGFLRMVNRNHLWNASSYSINSLFSATTNTAALSAHSGSVNGLQSIGTGGGTTRPGGNSLLGGSTRSKSSVSLTGVSLSSMSRDSLSGKAPLGALYDMLIAPMEDMLTPLDNRKNHIEDLVLVLQGDLYLIPFAILRNSQMSRALYERFNLIAVPSIRALQASAAFSKQNRYNPDWTSCLAVGNPKLPQSVMENWQWGPLLGAEQEVRMTCDMMGSQPLTGAGATKDAVLQQIDTCEVVHFATHISWKLAALVLSSHGGFSTTSSVGGNLERMDLNESNSDIDNLHGPSLSEFLLTAADILNHQMVAKLVVLSSGHSEDRAGRINSDGVVGLTRAFLAAGAQCVLFSLWPVPDLASRAFFKAFYTSLLQGAKTSAALSDAMRAVQTSKTYSHPANWAGWVLVGSDVKLTSKVALMGHALCQLLKSPSTAREGMRVVLHLVEKSLQRIRMNQRNAMYTTVMSIENKVGQVLGWRDLLTAVGFRFEVGNNSLPDALFFPTSDPGDRLTQCSASLQALLGLTVPTLTALSKMTEHTEIGEALTTLIRDVNQKYSQGDATIQLPVSVHLWRAPGCHEFLASLGLDLVDVGRDEVIIKAGKQANRRLLQFALQALVAIFDTQEAPRTLLLDASSSMESLNSTGSNTSTSNFSKGSSPPSSPNNWKKKSFFNPAEVDKLPSAGKASQNKAGKSRAAPGSVALQLNHQDEIRRKYSSPSASDTDPQDEPQLHTGECEEDNSSLCSNSGVPKFTKSSASNSSQCGSVRSAGSSRRIHHQPSQHPYSTSASDSEDGGGVPENNLSKALSQSRTSLVSQSSTLTIRSNGSGGGGGFRRTKARSSVASTRSSASDRTITNDNDHNTKQHEEFVWDSRENFSFDPTTDGDEGDSGNNNKHNLSVDIDNKKELEDKTSSKSVKQQQASIYNSSSKSTEVLTSSSVSNKVGLDRLDSGIDLQSSQTSSQNSPPQKQHKHTLEDIPGSELSSDLSLSLSSTASSTGGVLLHSPKVSGSNNEGELPPAGVISQRRNLFEKNLSPGISSNSSKQLSLSLSAINSKPLQPIIGGQKQEGILANASTFGGSAFTLTKPIRKPGTNLVLPSKPSHPSLQHQQQPWYQEGDVENPGNKPTLGEPATAGINPTLVAQKVIMETVGHKLKLDAMQKWSSQNLQQKRLSREMDDLKVGDDNENIGDNSQSGVVLIGGKKIEDLNENEIEVSSNLSDSSADKSSSAGGSGTAKLKLASVSLPTFSPTSIPQQQRTNNNSITPSQSLNIDNNHGQKYLTSTISQQFTSQAVVSDIKNSNSMPQTLASKSSNSLMSTSVESFGYTGPNSNTAVKNLNSKMAADGLPVGVKSEKLVIHNSQVSNNITQSLNSHQLGSNPVSTLSSNKALVSNIVNINTPPHNPPPDYNQIMSSRQAQQANKPKPILANSLRDNNSTTFTIATSGLGSNMQGGGKKIVPVGNKSNATVSSSGVPDLQEEIIERQLNRLNEGLATIPEYGVSQFSSTDTDYEPIQNLPLGLGLQNKGALKSARTRSAMRQKVVKFKDEVGGNIESPNEDGLTTSSSDFIQVRQAMARPLSTSTGLSGRFSDDDLSSQSESEMGSSFHSSFLNSSLSSREGSLTAPLIPGLLVQQKVNSIMQNIRPPSPGKSTSGGVGPPTGPSLHPLRPPAPPTTTPPFPPHLKPQSPTGSSSGTATPPYIPPSLGTPPYKPPSLYGTIPGHGPPTSAQIAGHISRYTSGYTPPYPGAQKPSSPVTSTPMVPPRPPQRMASDAGNVNLATPNTTNTTQRLPNGIPPGSPIYGGSYPSLPSSPEVKGGMGGAQQGGGGQDFNSPSNLHLASMKFYATSDGTGTASPGTPGSSGAPPTPPSQPTPPSIPGRVPISSLVQQGAGSRNPQAACSQYVPNSRFQPMNRSNSNLHHASSVESIQSLQSFHSFPGFGSGQTPQSPPSGGYVSGHVNLPGASSKEWYQSDSEASVYASGEEMMQYAQALQAEKQLQSQIQQQQQQQQQRNSQVTGQTNQMKYISSNQSNGNYSDTSHDDSWYKTTTDEEGESPKQPPQRMMMSSNNAAAQMRISQQQQQQMMMSSKGVISSQQQQQMMMSSNNAQALQMMVSSSSVQPPQQVMMSPVNGPPQPQGYIPTAQQNGPPTMPQQQPRIMNPASFQQQKSSVAYSQQIRNAPPQGFMSATSRPVAQYATPLRAAPFRANGPGHNMQAPYNSNMSQASTPQTSHSYSLMQGQHSQNAMQHSQNAMQHSSQGQFFQGHSQSVNDSQGQYPTNQNPPVQYQQSQNVVQNNVQSLHQNMTYSQNSSNVLQQQSNAQQQGSMTSSQHVQQSSSSTNRQTPPPQLPPRSRPAPPQYTMTSSGSVPPPTSMTSSISAVSTPPASSVTADLLANGDDVNISEDEKWVNPKAQQMAEHQTRMGFLFRDMNLKASQC